MKERTLADVTTREEQEEVMRLWGSTYGEMPDWLVTWEDYKDDICSCADFLVWYEDETGNWKPFEFFTRDDLEGLTARLRENTRYHVRWAREGIANWWE